MRLTKLTNRGFTHGILAVGFAVVFAIAGVGYIVASHAQTPTAHKTSLGTYTITAYATRNDPSRKNVYHSASAKHPCGPYRINSREAPYFEAKTSSGRCPRPKRTVAVNNQNIKTGTWVCIAGGLSRLAEDTGARPGTIDMYFRDMPTNWKNPRTTVTLGRCTALNPVPAPAPAPALAPAPPAPAPSPHYTAGGTSAP